MLKKLFFKKLLIIDTNIIDYILKLKSTQDVSGQFKVTQVRL